MVTKINVAELLLLLNLTAKLLSKNMVHECGTLYRHHMCVTGVTVLKGQEEIEVRAPVVISNAGIFNTFQKFLPKQVQESPGQTVLNS